MKWRSFHTAVIAAAVAVIVASLFIEPAALHAQQTPKKRSKKHPKSGIKISVDSAAHFTPTRTFGPNTVGGYFFPTTKGATWTMQSVQTILNDSGKVVRRDTVFSREVVVDTARFSLQGLPLVACRDYGYKRGSRDTVKTESFYYVDDSIAMTVFNNSVSHQMNKMFLVAPISAGNRWHDQYGDSVMTAIAGYVDSVVTPLGRFDSVLVTLTRRGYSDFRKFFARRYGIVKTIFRSPGPGGHGIVIIETDMIACTPRDEH